MSRRDIDKDKRDYVKQKGRGVKETQEETERKKEVCRRERDKYKRDYEETEGKNE